MISLRRLALCMVLLMTAASGAALAQGRFAAFGQYPQGASGEPAPLIWRLIGTQQGQTLLLSDKVLDARPAETQGRGFSGFSSSALAQWLSLDFAQSAFSSQELSLLREMDGLHVSLPSVDMLRDADSGFGSQEDRVAYGTAYALSRGVKRYNGAGVSYWTSSASQGSANSLRRVMDGGVLGIASVYAADIGVRPLICLPESAVSGARGSGSLDDPLIMSSAETADSGLPPLGTVLSPEKAPEGEDTMPEGFPPLTPEGFLPEGEKEYVFADEAAGLWRYASQTLRLEIRRHELPGPVRYLAAELYVKEGAQQLRMVSAGEGFAAVDRAANLAKPVKIAKKNKLVFSMDGDYYLYRVGRAKQAGSGYPIGVEIRDGAVIFDNPPSPARDSYPPLDMMALFPDGDMRVYRANELTAQELLALGARDVLSFGPYLIRDGEVNRSYTNYGTTLQPRAGIGMYGKGHYLAIIAEGRIRSSKGMTCLELAELFSSYGCPTAFNLDGGWTSAMVFMGKQLNQLDNTGVKDNARTQNEVMGVGYTNAFDNEDAK